MLSSAIPTLKFPIPFGNAAGGGFIRDVPTASRIGIEDGAASLNDGFVPLNFNPVASGGVPPFGKDMNGIMKAVTSWLRWQQSGGPIYYDATFSASIGGYPLGALLRANNGLHAWLSTTENNVTNPETGGAGWIVPDVASFNGRTGTVTLTLADVTTALGFTPVQQGTGVLQLANIVKIGYTAAGKVRVTIDNSDLGNFALETWVTTNFGGLGTPNTWAGLQTFAVGLNASTGNITANAGRLRAALGAFGSGDTAASVLLGDFAASISANGYCRLPNGLILNWGIAAGPAGAFGVTFTTYVLGYSSFVMPVMTPIILQNSSPVSSWIYQSQLNGFFLTSNAPGPQPHAYIAIGI